MATATLAAPAMYAAQAPVVEYIAPAQAVAHAATAPIVDFISPVPAGSYVAPAPVVEYVATAPALYAAPAPVVAYIAPAPAVYAASAPVVEYIVPAPAVYAAQAPVVEYIAPAPAVYAAQAPHCASTGILLEAFNSPTVYVAIQTLLSLYGSRERSAVCTRVDAVSVMSLSGPSFLEVGCCDHKWPTTSSSMPVHSLTPFFLVASVQTFRAHSRLVRILRFYIFRCYSAAAAQCHPCLASLEKSIIVERTHPILSE